MIEFHTFEGEFLRLYHAGCYADAMSWLRLGGGQFPDKGAILYFWRACISALLGQPEQAVIVLEQGYDLGYWWAESLLRGDSDLAILQERPDFIDLIARCEARHLETEKNSPSEVLVYLPEPGFSSPYPLLLGLHGRKGSPEALAQPFLPMTRKGWLLALVRSSQMLLPGGYAWDDRQRAIYDVKSMLEEVTRQVPVDSSRIVSAGFSQGGGLALELALTRRIQTAGVVAFAPCWHIHDTSREPGAPDFKVWMVTGELDTDQAVFTRIEGVLDSLMIPCHREVVPNLGHDLPKNIIAQLEMSVNFFIPSDRRNHAHI